LGKIFIVDFFCKVKSFKCSKKLFSILVLNITISHLSLFMIEAPYASSYHCDDDIDDHYDSDDDDEDDNDDIGECI